MAKLTPKQENFVKNTLRQAMPAKPIGKAIIVRI